ncbi:hypothetical protein J437_LFUL000704 [Ladona fulva]|uniref:Uncharacterized protein n=1 Tax=Ladona fulva TaxID=123851 RepID=A0A8K0NV23_LADFU|nr:hypothetical protein J437_LFUL000704 [Ladona fulva]
MAMHLSRAVLCPVRLTVQQGIGGGRQLDRLVLPSAFLLAGLGLALSSFSLKQLLSSKAPKSHWIRSHP